MLRSRKAMIAGAFDGMAIAGSFADTALAVPGANPNSPAYYGPNLHQGGVRRRDDRLRRLARRHRLHQDRHDDHPLHQRNRLAGDPHLR